MVDDLTVELSLADARRIGLRAQGFGARRPPKPTATHVRKTIAALGAVQIDAVNVLVRSHYLPLFSRLGPYDRALFDRVAYRDGAAFEYLAHAAGFVPVELYNALRWRMAEFENDSRWGASMAAIDRRNPGYADRIVAEIAARGPLSFKELTDQARRDKPKTKYADSTMLWVPARPSDGKHVMEWMWRAGRLAVAGRAAGFERIFDLADRVVPREVLATKPPKRAEATRVLTAHAVASLGVGWVKDIATYFGLPITETKAKLAELIEDGSVVAASVEGVKEKAYLDPSAKPRLVNGRALLSPFDSLLWQRARNVTLLGFTHSFEIYVTEQKRKYGYYVLPFLLDEAIVARVDLKADRANATLRVAAAYAEPAVPVDHVVSELAAELRTMATWLGLDATAVGERGDLARPLRRAVARGGH